MTDEAAAGDDGDDTPAPEPYTEKDCYVDLRDGYRVMDVKLSTGPTTTMSAQICYEMCTDADEKYTYFGLQFAFQCWCSETLADSETTKGAICETPCVNNTDEMCGGYDAILAYTIN